MFSLDVFKGVMAEVWTLLDRSLFLLYGLYSCKMFLSIKKKTPHRLRHFWMSLGSTQQSNQAGVPEAGYPSPETARFKQGCLVRFWEYAGLQTPQPLCQCLNTEELLFILKISWMGGSHERLLEDLATVNVFQYFCERSRFWMLTECKCS